MNRSQPQFAGADFPPTFPQVRLARDSPRAVVPAGPSRQGGLSGDLPKRSLSLKNVLLRTLIHQRVPDALRGRAFAAYNGARNGAELGALVLGGVVVGVLGARPALLVAGLGPAAIGTVALLLLIVRRRDAAALTTNEGRVLHTRVEG